MNARQTHTAAVSMQDFTPTLMAGTGGSSGAAESETDKESETPAVGTSSTTAQTQPEQAAFSNEQLQQVYHRLGEVNAQIAILSGLLDDVSPEEYSELSSQISELVQARGSLNEAIARPTTLSLSKALSLANGAVINDGLEIIDDAQEEPNAVEEDMERVFIENFSRPVSPRSRAFSDIVEQHSVEALPEPLMIAFIEEAAAMDGVNDSNIAEVVNGGLPRAITEQLMENALARVMSPDAAAPRPAQPITNETPGATLHQATNDGMVQEPELAVKMDSGSH